MERIGNKVVGCFVMVALAFSAVLLFGSPPTVAATGAPNMGNFARDPLPKCIGQLGPIPAVRMTGAWQGRAEAVIGIATDRSAPPLYGGGVFVTVNGEGLSPIPDKMVPPHLKPGLYFKTVPAWDGVKGHEPVISINVNNPQLNQPIYVNMKWVKGESFGLLATGWANVAECVFTTNPQPA